MTQSTRRIHPLVAAAAVAIILFSALGVGMMTGLIPSSKSSSPDAVSSSQMASTGSASPKRSADSKPAKVAAADSKPAQSQAPAAAACTDCGVITSINVVDIKGEGTGLGAAGGAVVGGIAGNQVGSGRGNTAATVVGAVGGAIVGNEVEKRMKSSKQYNVAVRMDSGTTRTFTFVDAPGYAVGEKVKIVDGRLVRA